jgi:hypothetical protein
MLQKRQNIPLENQRARVADQYEAFHDLMWLVLNFGQPRILTLPENEQSSRRPCYVFVLEG